MEIDVFKSAKNVKVNFYETLGQEKLQLSFNTKHQENVKNVKVHFMTRLLISGKIYLNMSSTDLLKKLINLIFV